MAKHAFDPERKIELLAPDRRAPRGRRRQAARGLRHLRARLPRGAALRAHARAARPAGPEPRALAGSGQLVRLGRRRRSPTTISRSQLLYQAGPDPRDRARQRRGAVATYERILKVAPEHGRRGHRDPARSTSATATTRRWSAILKRKSEIIIDLPERKELLYKAAQMQEEVLERSRRRDRDLPHGARSRRHRHAGDGRARAALRPPRAVGAAQGRLRQEGRAGRGARATRSRCSRPRPGLRPRARRRRQGDRDLPGHPRSRRRRAAGDPVARPAVTVGGALVRPARRTSSARSSWPRPGRRDRRAQVPHRPALAAPAAAIWRASIESYREALEHRRRRTRDPGRPRRRSCTARRASRSWPPACSSRSTRPAASSRSWSTCSR